MANLLALRDGEMDPVEARHLEGDPEAARQLSALAEIRQALNALPDIQPGPAVWDAVRSRAAMRHAAQQPARNEEPGTGSPASPRRAPVPLAMAAGLLVALAVGIVALVETKSGPAIEMAGSMPGSDAALQALYARSQALEALWSGGYRIPDATERVYLYRIADLDSQLALAEPGDGSMDRYQLEQLWSRRVELLESLAEIRRTRAVLQPAVY